jgi:hypothetical protein
MALTELAFTSGLCACFTASDEMQDKQYQAHNQDKVDESSSHVKCEKSKQPKNNQNCGDYPKHVFISLRLRVRTSAALFFQAALMPFRVRKKIVRTRI